MRTKYVLMALAAIALMLPGQAVMGAVTAYWSFDADFTNNPATTGGSAMDGVGVGNVTVANSIVAAAAKFGAAGLKIDDNATGIQHCVDINTALADWTSDPTITVMGWYNHTVFGTGDAWYYPWETGPSWSVGMSVNGGLQRWAHMTGTQNFNDLTGPAIADETWYHAVQVWNGVANTIKYYHNGGLRDYRYVPVAMQQLVNSTVFHIGSSHYTNGSRNFEGYLDEVAVFSHEPTAEVIASIISGAETPVTAATDVAPLHGIRVVDTERLILAETITFDDPSGLTIASDGTVYAGRRNCETETIVGSYPASTSDGGVYLLAAGSKVAPGHMPSDVVVDADGDLFFTEDFNGKIKRIASGESTASDWVTGLNTGIGDSGPDTLLILTDDFTGGGALVGAGNGLVVDRTDGKISVWDPDSSGSLTVLHDGTGLTDPKALAASVSTIFVADSTNTIFTVNPDTGALSALATSGVAIDNPVDMVVDPVTGDLFVLCDSDIEPTKILRIDADTGVATTVVDTMLDGFKDIYDGYYDTVYPDEWKYASNFSGMAMSADGQYLYVAEQDGDAVYKLRVIPEPSSVALLLAGLLGVVALRRRS